MTKSAPSRSVRKSVKPKKSRKIIRRTQEERTSATTAKIIAATRDCIIELGYTGTTMSAIAKRAGVTHGALQHHYGSRTNVFKALIDKFFDSLSHIEESTMATNSMQARKNFLKESFGFYGTALPVAIMLLRVNVQAEPEIRDAIEGKFGPLNVIRNQVWNRLFEAAGLSPSDVDLMREIVIAMLRGFAARQAYQRKISSIDEELSVITEMIELYIAKHGAKRNATTSKTSKSARQNKVLV